MGDGRSPTFEREWILVSNYLELLGIENKMSNLLEQ